MIHYTSFVGVISWMYGLVDKILVSEQGYCDSNYIIT